jgi:hypothetical protein
MHAFTELPDLTLSRLTLIATDLFPLSFPLQINYTRLSSVVTP